MAFTVLMFLVLILSFALMLGFVQFAENVIAKPRLAPLNGEAAKAPAAGAKSL
jgi:hypothetical protein